MTGRNSRDEPPERLAWEYGFTRGFLDDLTYWTETDVRVARQLTRLMREVARDPFTGTGRPEALKHLGSDVWSRRLTPEHRLVYQVDQGRITFLQARFHY